MNKDVIYIEPEDDITDIISKLEDAKEKIVALVPPKKAGVLRSVVNIKLLAKSAANSEKTLVLVTTDDSIVKLAALAHLPVTKDLQTAPVIPSPDEVAAPEKSSPTTVVEKEKIIEKTAHPSAEQSSEKAKSPTAEQPEEQSDSKPQKVKTVKKTPKFIQWIKDHKKLSIACACVLVILIGVLVWAFVIAPAVTISVTIRTTSADFSENVSLVSDAKNEDAENGIFTYATKTKTAKQETTFTATGSKNNGNKASGKLVVYASFPISVKTGSTSVSPNTVFTFNGLNYYVSETVTLSWDGNFASCDNASNISSSDASCVISATVAATAAEPGTKYNVSGSTSGWTTSTSAVGAYSETGFSGGTDDVITVVSQSDIDKAKESLTQSDDLKESFLKELSEDDSLFVISQSFKESDVEYTSSPAVGEEVKNGATPTLTATTTATVFTVDKAKIEEFISAKAKLGDDQKIYSVGDPFIENLSEKDGSYSGKLKTKYYKSSKVTEEEILENVKGKKIGEVKAALSSISGVVKDSTKIETSYFWVSSVPNDPNKITVYLNIEEEE